MAILVQVSDGYRVGKERGGKLAARLEGAVPVAQQHRDRVRAVVRHGEVGDGVGIEEADRDRAGIVSGLLVRDDGESDFGWLSRRRRGALEEAVGIGHRDDARGERDGRGHSKIESCQVSGRRIWLKRGQFLSPSQEK